MSGISPTDGLPLVQAGSGGSTAGRYPSRRRLDNVHMDGVWHLRLRAYWLCMDTAGHGKGEYHHAYANDVHGCAVMAVCVACTWD